MFGDAACWISKFRELYLSHGPLRELDQLVGNPSPWFQACSSILRMTSCGGRCGPLPPAMRTSRFQPDDQRHYDDDQFGAMHYYRMHRAYGGANAQRHYRVMGPRGPCGHANPQREVGGLSSGPASLLDLNALHKSWYDWN